MEQVITMPDGKQYKLVPVEQEEKQDDMFNIVEGDTYFYRTSKADINVEKCTGSSYSKKLFEIGNACKDKEYIRINCLEAELHDRLRKYSYQHGWNDSLQGTSDKKYYIYYDMPAGDIRPRISYSCCQMGFHTVYFADYNAAMCAIYVVVKPFLNDHPEYEAYLKGEHE